MLQIILFNLLGLLLIVLIAWWFWVAKSKKVIQAKDIIEIKVANGVYKPDAIEIKKDTDITLRFIREDENPCSGTVVIDAFEKSADLPVATPTDLIIRPNKTGEFEFTCQMGMYRGRLIVRD